MSDAGEIVHTPDEWHPYGIDSMQGPDFTEAEARQITTKMNAYMASGFRLLEVAHERKAWAALGYSRFVDYLTAETSWGKSRGFQLLAHARALNMLTAAAGLPEKSTMVDSLIPERVTRDLDVAAVADAVDAAAADLPDDATDGDRAAIVADAVSQALAAVDPGKAVVPAALEEPEGEQEQPCEDPAAPEGVAGPPPAAPSRSTDGPASTPSPEAGPSRPADPPGYLDGAAEPDHEDVEEAVRAAEAEHVRPALAAAPAPSEHPAVGDLVDWWPNPGQWRSTAEFQTSDDAREFASVMDRREPRTHDDPASLARCCPAALRPGAAIAAKNAAAWWNEMAEHLNRPTRLAAVENDR